MPTTKAVIKRLVIIAPIFLVDDEFVSRIAHQFFLYEVILSFNSNKYVLNFLPCSAKDLLYLQLIATYMMCLL